jgi:hypothetical protein
MNKLKNIVFPGANAESDSLRVRRTFAAITLLIALAMIVSVIGISLYYANSMARTWDEVDFALAVTRYDLLAMQPHFPGYPYFILGGWVMQHIVRDPAQALSVFNTLAACSSVVPMVLLARRLAGGGAGALLLPALVLSSPYIWLLASRPMSESAGLSLLWWFLWSVREAMERPDSKLRHAVPLLLFGFLMGTRLSFFPFGLFLLPLWLTLYKKEGNRWRSGLKVALSVSLASLFQLTWIAGLVMSEGTLSGFWKLSLAFLKGHFSEWGGGVVSIPMPLDERVVRLLWHNLFNSVLTGGSAAIGVLFLIAVLASVAGFRRGGSSSIGRSINRRYLAWLAGAALSYLLWALIGQNIEKPRHIVPLAVPILLMLHVMAIRSAVALSGSASGKRRSLAGMIYASLAALILAQWVYGAPLQKRQVSEKPAVYQLDEYVSRLDQPLVLFTWEETRVLQYMSAKYEHQRIYTFGYFKALAEANPSRKVLLTDHVLRGFEQQGAPVGDHVRKLAEFKSDVRFDPVYSDIILYEWTQ